MTTPLGVGLAPEGAQDPGSRAVRQRKTGAATGQRRAGLFPLHIEGISRAASAGLSRRQLARLQAEVESCAQALNWLHGEPTRPSPVRVAADTVKRARLQTLTQRRLELACGQWMSDRRALEPEECLSRLLKGRSPYGDSASATLASFSHSRLSLPDSVHGGPYVEDICDAEVSIMLSDFERHMLRPKAEVEVVQQLRGQVGCHTDPVLANDERLMRGLSAEP